MPIPQQSSLPNPGYPGIDGSEWIRRLWAQLPDREWVAADDGGWIANDPTYTGLLTKIRDKQKNPADVVVTFVDRGAF